MFVLFKCNTTGVHSGAGGFRSSGVHEVKAVFRGVRDGEAFVFCVVFCSGLFVPLTLSFLYWPLNCLSLYLRLLITELVSLLVLFFLDETVNNILWYNNDKHIFSCILI